MMEIERPKIETASLSPDGRYASVQTSWQNQVKAGTGRGFGITLGNESLKGVVSIDYEVAEHLIVELSK